MSGRLRIRDLSEWALVFGLVLIISSSLRQKMDMEDKFLIPPPTQIENLTFGLKYQIADGLWIRAIQDLDYCESKMDHRTCRGKSWVFQMLDVATRLDPSYKVIYSQGGLALTVVISDYAGASIIFDRGIENYPDDLQILTSAAYHALFEERDFEKASRLYRRAAENGGPNWFLSLSGKLLDKDKRLKLAEWLLAGMIQRKENPLFIDHMKKKIEQFKSESLN